MKRSLSAFGFCVFALSSQPGYAWCPFGDAPDEHQTAFIFWIEDDFSSWNNVVGGSLSSNPTHSNYYRTVIERAVDASLQSWSRYGRVPVKVALAGWKPACPEGSGYSTPTEATLCGVSPESSFNVSLISARKCYSILVDGSAPATGDTTLQSGATRCDIEFRGPSNLNSTCVDNVAPLFKTPSSTGNEGILLQFHRLLRHEIGHCLGAGHTNQNSNTNCDIHPGCGVTADCPGGWSCVSSSCTPNAGTTAIENNLGDSDEFIDTTLMQRPKHDHPGGDDVESIHQVQRRTFVMPEREVWLSKGYLNTSNSWTLSSDVALGISAIMPPRVYCGAPPTHGGSVNPDCVLIGLKETGSNEQRLFVNGLENGTLLAGITTQITSRRTPDIAYTATSGVSPSISPLYVAVVAPTNQPSTSVAPNQLNQIQVIRYRGLGSGETPTQVSSNPLDASTNDDLTWFDPRIAFVRGLGGSCTVSSSTCDCQNNWCQAISASVPLGRFLVASVRADRQPRLYLSTDNNATSFTQLTETGTGNFLGMRVKSALDIACPVHSTPSVADRQCRVVFNSYTSTFLDNRLTQCTLNIRGTTFDVASCVDSFGASPTDVVSLTDYGAGAPSTQRQTYSWVLGLSNSTPQISLDNSRWTVYTSNGTTLSATDIVSNLTYDIDRDSCSEMISDSSPNNDIAISYFGGSTIDYCEGCDQIYRVGFGDFTTSGVPADACY